MSASRVFRAAWGWLSSRMDHVSSSICRSRPGRMTWPWGRWATVRMRVAMARMPPVVPAMTMGWSGGVVCQARVWASRRRTWRSAGSSMPIPARMPGQWAVTIWRKWRVSAQCLAKPSSTRVGRVSARVAPSRWASSSRRASSAASGQARSAVVGAPKLPSSWMIRRERAARRRGSGTGGGRSSAPARVRGASSSAPMAVMRGRRRGRPSAARRKASASARAARRVGRRKRALGVSGAVGGWVSHQVARVSRNGAPGGMVWRFIGGGSSLGGGLRGPWGRWSGG